MVENYAGEADLEAGVQALTFLSSPVLLPGRLVTDTKLLLDKLNCSPSQLHYACSRSSAVEEAMPDTLIHALKISAGLGMRVRRQIWETYIRSADALSMRRNGRRMETCPPTWGYDPTWRR